MMARNRHKLRIAASRCAQLEGVVPFHLREISFSSSSFICYRAHSDPTSSL